MWKPKPSATRLRPIINRKLRQSTTTVGCWLTNRVSGLDASNITAIAITTAAIITGRWFTMPTAVITASSEKTASSTTICRTTTQKLAYPLPWPSSCCRFSSRSCSSVVALNSRKSPPTSMIKSRPEKVKSMTVNRGLVSVTIHEITDSRPSRMISASERPIRRALSRCFGGSLSARMAINTRLSIPRTISSTTSVSKPTQIDGSIKNSMTRSC